MKKSVLFLAAIICMMMQTVSATASDRIIPASKLPGAAKAFVEKNFPGKAIAYSKQDVDFASATYEVLLSNGIELEFDDNGTWDKVDCKYTAVPSHLVPSTISKYVKANFSGTAIVKIDKKRYGYEVELSNNIDLKFNKNGQLIAYDD